MGRRIQNQRPARTKPMWTEHFVRLWTGCFLICDLFLIGEDGFTAISGFRAKTFYILTALLLGGLACCLGAQMLGRAGRSRSGAAVLRSALEPRPGVRPVQWVALIYLVLVLCSAALSPYGKRAWYDEELHEGALTVSCYVFCFLALSQWGRASRGLLYVFAAVLAGTLAVCFGQIAGGNPLGYYPAGYSFVTADISRAFMGTVGNVDLVSTLLSLAAPIALVLGLWGMPWGLLRKGGARRVDWKRLWIHGVLLAEAVLCVPVMLRIRVLCGLVGLGAGLVITAFVLVPVSRRAKLIFLGGAGAAAVCVLLYLRSGAYGARVEAIPVESRSFVTKFLYEVHQLLNGTVDEHFGSSRFYIWRQILQRIPKQLWFGSGPDTVRLTGLEPILRYENSVLVAGARITDAHCLPLELLYCQGLPALTAWLALLVLSARRWVQNRHRPGAAALGAGLVCFLISMLFCMSSVIIMPFFWICLGLLWTDGPEKTQSA